MVIKKNQIDCINKIIEKYIMKKTKQIKTPCRKITEYERNNSNLIDPLTKNISGGVQMTKFTNLIFKE